MTYKLSSNSVKHLRTCHVDLQLIIQKAIALTDVDFGVSEGHRSLERQKELYDEGKSKIDGISKKGYHNYTPSMACDIYGYVNGKTSYNREKLSFIAGVIMAVAKDLYKKGKIKHHIEWGGNWDSFKDYPHFQLVKPKQ